MATLLNLLSLATCCGLLLLAVQSEAAATIGALATGAAQVQRIKVEEILAKKVILPKLNSPSPLEQKIAAHINDPTNVNVVNGSVTRVVGGRNAVAGEVPFQVGVFLLGEFLCGGTFLSPHTVLTAAHCTSGFEEYVRYFTIGYGSLNRAQLTTIPVVRITTNPSYNEKTMVNDVALLHLQYDFTPSTNAAVVTLASEAPAANTAVRVSGWGQLSSTNQNLPGPLQIATTLTVMSSDQCNARWGAVNTIDKTMLCAFSTTQAACNGDSGGPLVDPATGKQVGVVSWGEKSCLHSYYPTVYGNVAQLRSWIVKNGALGRAQLVPVWALLVMAALTLFFRN